jgi:MoaA/NifB/PqqE/SkfB family radical SAM enzyme
MTTRHLLNLTTDRIASLPILILYLTDGCNSRCVTCDIWQNPRLNMRRELVEQLASEITPLGVRWVVLSGGEAMQHPGWAQIARRFRSEGARVILLTNGLYLRKQADDVIASVDEVVVSLDGGTAHTYEAIRGVDGFDLVLEGVRAVRAGGVPVTTRTVVQRANYAEMPLIVRAAKAADASSISFLTVDTDNPYAFGSRDLALPMHDAHTPALLHEDIPRLQATLDALERDFAADFASRRMAESPAKLRRMVGYFRALLGEADYPPVRCNAPHTSIVVQVDGSLRPCYFLPLAGETHVSAKQPLAHLLNSPEALALRRAYRTGQRSECNGCVCPLYKGARALLSM